MKLRDPRERSSIGCEGRCGEGDGMENNAEHERILGKRVGL